MFFGLLEAAEDKGCAVLTFALILAIGLWCLLVAVFMWLWNWLMVDLFALPYITYGEAVGLYILSNLIFKSSTSTSKKD